jgi:hypothetical protein
MNCWDFLRFVVESSPTNREKREQGMCQNCFSTLQWGASTCGGPCGDPFLANSVWPSASDLQLHRSMGFASSVTRSLRPRTSDIPIRRTKASLTSFTCFGGAHYRYPSAWCLWLAPTWTLGLMHNYPPVCIPSAPGPSISTLNQVRNCTFNKYKMSRPISAVWCLETVDFKVSEIPDSKLHSVNSLQMKVFLLTTQILSYYYYKSNPMRTQISCL